MGPAAEGAAASGDAAGPDKKEEALQVFIAIGLDPKTAQNAVANPKVTANLLEVIEEVSWENGLPSIRP